MHPTRPLIGVILLCLLGCAHAPVEVATDQAPPAATTALDKDHASGRPVQGQVVSPGGSH